MSILVLIRDESEAHVLIRIAHKFAVAKDVELIIAGIGKSEDYADEKLLSEITEDDKIAPSIQSALFELSSEIADASPKVVSFNQNNFITQVVQEAHNSKASLLIIGFHTSGDLDSEDANEVFSKANCDTLLLRVGKDADGKKFKKVLVPVGGGPHGILALRYGDKLARADKDGTLVALYIDTSADKIYEEVGQKRLDYFLHLAGLQDEENDHIQKRVSLSDDIAKAISNVAEEEFDLVIIGASSVGSIRRTLFGTLSDKLLTGADGVALGVFRARKPLVTRLRQGIEDLLDLVVPQISREERIALFDEVAIRSKWNFDFLVLIVLSTIIASLGLLQNSGAVVIGAMLVAPLMTPLLGTGLSVLQENVPLFKSSTYAVIFGFIAAFFSSAAVGLFYGEVMLTDQMLARTSPSILDVAVGFLSGLAAAHCISRPGLSAALPGVAIAAALVPPIATSGLSFSMGQFSHTMGSFLLFFTNVVAIVLGSSTSFFGGGVRPKKEGEGGSSWPLHVSGLLILILTSLIVLYSGHPRFHGRNLPEHVSHKVISELALMEGTLKRADVVKGEDGGLKVLLEVSAPLPLPLGSQKRLVEIIKREMRESLEVELKTELLSRMKSEIKFKKK